MPPLGKCQQGGNRGVEVFQFRRQFEPGSVPPIQTATPGAGPGSALRVQHDRPDIGMRQAGAVTEVGPTPIVKAVQMRPFSANPQRAIRTGGNGENRTSLPVIGRAERGDVSGAQHGQAAVARPHPQIAFAIFAERTGDPIIRKPVRATELQRSLAGKNEIKSRGRRLPPPGNPSFVSIKV
jgi:hypothetical protein